MNGLTKIEKEIKYNKMQFNDKLEDIHTHIESRLIELIGSLGKNFILQGLEMIKSLQILKFG